MTRPQPTDFVLGHRAMVAASSTIAVLTTLSWFAPRGASWFVTGLTLLFCKATFAAKKRVAIWRRWNGAWEAMAEPMQAPPAGGKRETPKQSAASESSAAVHEPVGRKPRRIPRWALIAAWLVLFAWLKSHQGEASTPSLGIGALCFFAIALWGAFAATRKAGRWLLAPARPRESREAATGPAATDADGNAIVAQCLPVPTAAPLGHVRDALPAYCRDLIGRKPHEASSGT